jgi:hypothetical protein
VGTLDEDDGNGAKGTLAMPTTCLLLVSDSVLTCQSDPTILPPHNDVFGDDTKDTARE